MSNQIQAQIARRRVNRYLHLHGSMVPSPAHEQNLTMALHIACVQNDADRVTQLMGMGARRDARSESGATALEVAEQRSYTNIVKRLMADVDIEKAGVVELLYAIRRGQATVVRALMEMGVKEQLQQDEVVFRGVFLMACAISNTFVVNALLRYGPSLNVVVYEEIFVRVARITSNLGIAELIHEISDGQRRRSFRDARASGQLSTGNNNAWFNEFVQMPETMTANGVEEEIEEDESWSPL